MEKKVLLKKLVEEGRHIRKEFTPTAIVSDNGVRPIGEFWDANKTIDVIVNGAEIAHDTIREVDELAHEIERNLATEETRAKGAESNLQDAINAEVTRATAAEQHLDDIKADKTDLENNYLKNYTLGDPDLGHDYVDLGLQSGTLWATMNLGASSITDYGNYYTYGNTQPYSQSTSYDGGSEDPLPLNNDAANTAWGNGWHIPTQTQLTELVNSCTFEDTTVNNVNCVKITGPNNKYIYIPYSGYYQFGQITNVGVSFHVGSSTPGSAPAGMMRYALSKSQSYDASVYGTNPRSNGDSIRPVHEPAEPAHIPVYGVTAEEKSTWNSKIDQTTFNSLVARVEALEQAQ